MKKAGIFCLLMMTHLLLSSPTCLAGDRAGAFSISPFAGGYSFDGTQQIETKPVYGLRLGYDATKNLAVEGVFAYVATEATRFDQKLDVYSYRLDLLYNLMPDKKLAPYLAMGGGLATKDPEQGISYTDMTFNFGGGVKYFFTESIALRGDVRQLLVFADHTVSNWEYSVGLSFLFGGREPPPPAAKPEPIPEPVAKPAAKPEPISEPVAKPAAKVAPTPVPKAPRELVPAPTEPTSDASKNRITLNILFYIETAIILDESRDEIGQLAAIMQKFPQATAVFEGHDAYKRSTEHNIILSQKRVESVVNYLVEKFGLARSRFSVTGYGETRPAASVSAPGRQADKRSVIVNFDCVIVR